jgi:hypothetical protein
MPSVPAPDDQGRDSRPQSSRGLVNALRRNITLMRRFQTAFACFALTAVAAGAAWSTPSTTYWTPCTIDIQPAGVGHITVDNYFTPASSKPREAFPTDLGLTFGAKLGSKLAVEYGFDVLSPASDPWYLNAKIGFRENTLSKNAPAVQLGVFNVGFNSRSNQSILDLIVGKSLPNGKTRIHVAGYIGNAGVLKSSSGDTENAGFMVGFDHVIIPNRVILAGDYASGDNAIGGGGVGLYYYFTKDIDLLVGPVWFNDKGINGSTKMTVQLDINF